MHALYVADPVMPSAIKLGVTTSVHISIKAVMMRVHVCVCHTVIVCVDPPRALHALQGDAKAQMCDFCEDNSVDLLVVTSTVRGRIKKALSPMGGVSSQLVLEAPCPVLVLPTQAASECPDLLLHKSALH